MDSWHSYPSVYALGHRALKELFLDPVIVEEKIDGSQFSFGLFDDGLRVRSKGQVMLIDAPEKMFDRAVDTVKSLSLRPGWTYRAEYLRKPHHNGLSYSRIPNEHLILFDINPAEEEYLPYSAKAEEAARLGLEIVPLLSEGILSSADDVRKFLTRESVLGGQLIEGVVIKNYARFGLDKKVLMGKFVSEAQKEVIQRHFKTANPGKADIIDSIIQSYGTPARWQKAVQHLRERGTIEDSPRDIGNLIKEAPEDVLKECADDIRDALMKWAWPQIRRGITHGLPEWYKQLLLDKQFES